LSSVQSELVTRADLDAAMEGSRADLDAAMEKQRRESRADLDAAMERSRAALDAAVQTLRAEMGSSEERIRADVARHTRAVTEEIRTWFKVLDEKADARAQRNHEDLIQLRREFEQHRDDDQVHRRPRRRSQ
jgi:hypothetical protein